MSLLQLGVNGQTVGLWILGATALVCACLYFYFGFIDKKKNRGKVKLLEVVVIIIVLVVIIWPIASDGNIWSGPFLASLALLVYVIARLLTSLK